jgi:hypothetical protein
MRLISDSIWLSYSQYAACNLLITMCINILCVSYPSLYICLQEELLPGGHGLMVRGYLPVIHTLAKGLDIRLGHR